MITLERVSKAFGDRLALDAVSLEVPRGGRLALLGHNGAGKSTLFALILGLRRLTDGDIRVDGVSVRARPRAARRGIGSVLAPAFYEYLSGWDNLRILTSYSGGVPRPDMERVVGLVGLGDRIHDRVRTYSHGMRRRLALAQALLPRPTVLLLDEWEAGLDPHGMRDLRDLLLGLNRQHGMTVVVSSHQPSGLDGFADRVAILRAGRLAFAGPWRDLDAGSPLVRLVLDDWERATPVLRRLGAERRSAGSVALAAGAAVADLVAALVGAGVRVTAVEPIERSAEEIYRDALAEPELGASAGLAAPPPRPRSDRA
jgi:ABC-2 type transport system ATP-binding protein